MFETSFISNAAVSHGKTYETVALKKFSEVTELQASPCGFFVCADYSFLGCSPDAVIDEESIIEIKCPFNGRNSKVVPGKFFPFLETRPNGEIGLKRNHNFYYQILGQLAISKRKYCFFVVFTFVDIFIEKIQFDPEFFKNHMLPKLTTFFENHYRPFIASKL